MRHGKYGRMNYTELFTNTYKGKKILLTGHTGFKGAWLLTWLHHLGAFVKGYSLQPERENDLYNLLQADSWCDSEIGDIRDFNKLTSVAAAFQPDFIFHLAAQSLVRRSYHEPLYSFEVNTTGTANVLEAVRRLDKPCQVIIITTDKVYENAETDYAYKEDDKLGGYDPYSASKAAAEIVTSSYRNSFFNPAKYSEHQKGIASARAGNVIGGGDRAVDRIIPDIIRAMEKNETVVLRNPNAVRPWQHVLEPLSGYLLLGAKMCADPGSFSNSWNFGPDPADLLSVKQVTEAAIQEWGKGEYKIEQAIDQPHEAGLLKLDNSKAITLLGWKPLFNSSEAIRETIAWYKHAPANGVRDFTINQITKYQNLV